MDSVAKHSLASEVLTPISLTRHWPCGRETSRVSPSTIDDVIHGSAQALLLGSGAVKFGLDRSGRSVAVSSACVPVDEGFELFCGEADAASDVDGREFAAPN